MEFITVSHPDECSSTKLKRQARSHSARVAHARAKRLRHDALAQNLKALERGSQTDDTWANTEKGKKTVVLRQGESDNRPLTPPRTIDGAFEPEQFSIFVKALTTRERYLFQHYVQVVLPYLNHHCPVMQSIAENHEYTRQNWILFSSYDIDMLRGFLLAACRHLSMVYMEEEYAQYAIRYKLDYIQSLRETMSTKNPTLIRVAVTRALVLAFDEVMLGDLTMASNHVLGAVQIIGEAGGVQAVGLSPMIQYILYSCIFGKRLLDWKPVLHCGASFMKPELRMLRIA